MKKFNLCLSTLLTVVMLITMNLFTFAGATTENDICEHIYTAECDAVCAECLNVRDVAHTLDDNNSCCSVCNTQFGNCGDDIIWSVQDDVLILEGTGEMYYYQLWGDAVPWEMQKASVVKVFVSEGITSIGSTAFYNFGSLTEVELPSTVKRFGANAFAGCGNLKEITIPVELETIDLNAFANCGSMTEYKVAEGNTHFSVEDGVLFNADKTALWAYPIGSTETVYEMPDTVERVEAYAFSNATNLQSIVFSENLKHIGDEAFFGCTGLTAITLPDNTCSIGGGAFQDCENLSEIHLPENITRIGPLAFRNTAYFNNIENWENKVVLYLDDYVIQAREKWDEIGDEEESLELSGDYTIREGITLIADESFDFLYNLTGITLPVSLKYIGEGSFCYCKALTEINIPENVTHIGGIAFMGCQLLSDVDLPSGLQRIGYNAFVDTSYLDSLVTSDNPIGYHENYVLGAHSSLKVADIKEGITLIAENAFDKATSVTRITLPDSLEYIGAEAFANIYQTKNIVVPDTVKYIGDHALGFQVYYDSDLEDFVYNKIYNFSLSGYKDSVAEAYAQKYEIPFNYIGVCEHSYTFADAYPNGCNKPGVRTYTCELCADEYTTEIPGKHINVVIDQAQAPTCTDTGLTEGSHCSACGEVIVVQETIPASGHSYKDEITKQPTHLNDGIKTFTCITCGDTYTEFIENLKEHNYEISVKAPTCTTKGYTLYSCACGYSYIADEVDALGHNWNNWVIDVLPTCTDSGVKKSNCDVCGASVSVLVEANGHTEGEAVTENQKAADCKNEGSYDKVVYCSSCDEEISRKTITVAKKAHTNKTITTKATLTKNGKKVTKCTVCDKVSKTVTVYYPKTIKLSATTYTYNGKVQTPTVTIKDSKGNTLKKGTDYTVSYASGRKNTGVYAVTITFKGAYSGTKTLYFNILPSKTSKITPTCNTNSIKVSWNKVTGASGYKVELLNSKGKVVKTTTTTKTVYTFKSLSKVTTYKVRITAYKTIDSKKVYSTASTTITTSTAPATVTLSKVTAGSKSATPVWKNVSGATGYEIQYSTSSKFKSAKTATVSKGSSTKTTIKKLTSGKKYYFKVRAYKIVDGKKVYGGWSAVKSVKVK